MIHLNRPFKGTVPITQIFANLNPLEPEGFLYPDGSIGYTRAPGVLFGRYHNGVDYALGCGTALYAPADGVVTFAGFDQTGFGYCLKIDHGPITTLHGHLSVFDVILGQRMKAGQLVAHSGTSGNSTGCHLHWSVIDNADGRYVSPAPYLDFVPPPPPPPDPVTHVRFTVVVQTGDVNVRSGPTTHSTCLGQIAGGVSVRCDGWQRGQSIFDPTTGKQDTRWYHLADNSGWISSAHVVGNAPNSSP